MSKQHVTRKRFGQHFLTDQSVIHHIIQAIDPKRHPSLVEIGPGRGAITLPLLEYGTKIDVIEIDRDLVAWWQDKQRQGLTVNIHESDVLNFDFNQLGSKDNPIYLIGNLPYNISTPLFFHLIDFHDVIAEMCFMVQKEVALRITAQANEKPYGQLSVWLQLHYQTELLFDVAPESFKPPPKVDSSIIRLRPHKRAPVEVEDKQKFHRLIKAAFAQKRKTLRNNLKDWADIETFQQADIDPSRRAETLSLEEFAKLHQSIA